METENLGHLLYFGVLLLLLPEPTCQAAVDPLKAVIGPDGSYNITVLGVTWLRSAPTFFVINGQRYSTDDGSLRLTTINTTISGEGVFGASISTDLHYSAGDVPIIASIVYYAEAMLTFKVRFVTGASKTSQGNLDSVICGFPGFRLESKEKLGFMSFRGENLGFEKQSVGRWDHDADIEDGLEGSSPLTLFDTKDNSITIGPLDNFLSTAMWRDQTNNFLYWGIMGGVNELPLNFSYQIIGAYSTGRPDSLSVWGFIEYDMYYKISRPADITVNTIGYWTNEGSFYFDNGGQNTTNYEDTLMSVFSDAENNSLSYSYVEWDTWWFTKGAGGGVREWTAPSDVFPHGEKSSDNVYAKENGGNYSFEIVGDMAVPLDESFWDYIFQQSKEWGLIAYIQDNMTDIFRNFPRMKTDANFARNWLMKMAKSAARNNITIHFSGALPRIALEALELSAVTQIKASPSYGSSKDQWKIGLTSRLGSSLWTKVFKDVFQTSSTKRGSGWASSEKESLVATLSCGSVGIGDETGTTNRTLVNRTSSSGGNILKPNLPATAINAQLRQMAFQDGSGPDGEVWSTFSSVYKGGSSPQQEYGIIFVSGLKSPFDVTPNTTMLGYQYPRSKIFSPLNPDQQYDFSEDKPFTLPVCVDVDYCLYYTSPVIPQGGGEVLILGELDKWVPMSNVRETNVTVNYDRLTIQVKGQPHEHVKMWIASNGEVSVLNVEINQSGLGIFVFDITPILTPTSPPTSAASLFFRSWSLAIVCIIWTSLTVKL